MLTPIFLQSTGPNNLKAVFEDDGRVAYAYLIVDGKIEADVWLYNRGETPISPEWTNRDSAPFKNPAEYANAIENSPNTGADIKITWENQDATTPLAKIYISGELYALLKIGSKPGWAKLAKKDGPLAKMLKV